MIISSVKILLLFIVLYCGGCSIIPTSMGPFPEKQLVVVNGKGELLKPEGNTFGGKFTSLFELDNKIKLEDEYNYLEKAAEGIFEQLNNGKDVTLFIHGGMNTQFDSMERTHALLSMAEMNQSLPYFVFINWQSSLVSSYRDRLFAIREGKDFRSRGLFKNVMTKITSPFYLVSDTVTGVARAPVTVERQLATFVSNQSLVSSKSSDYNLAQKEFESTRKRNLPNVTIVENKESDPARTIPSILLSWARLVTTPFVDAYGTHAWDIMQRRTTILFNREIDIEDNDVVTDKRVHGPLYKFGLALLKSSERKSTEKDIKRGKFSLIGHSMGAILGVEFLKRFPDVHFDRIVFMAAACRVRDFTETIFPYLAIPQNKDTLFYNLTLHPQAETREFNSLWLGPEGSLLVWIDQWFDRPDSVLDRTAGRYVNLGMNARYLDKEIDRIQSQRTKNNIESDCDKIDISNRIFFKTFPYQKGFNPTVPMTHGSFDEFHFWEENFWKEPEVKADPKSGTR